MVHLYGKDLLVMEYVPQLDRTKGSLAGDIIITNQCTCHGLVEELECLATWKEGSSRYLVGRLHHGHASSNEDRYRCFVYEKAGQTVQSNLHRAAMGIGAMDHDVGIQSGPVPEGAAEIYRVAQSGDATCNGLFSPMEGSRTMTLMKVSPPGQCRFPNWLTGHSSGGLTWHTLDLTRSYTFHPRNASLHVTRSNNSSSRFENGPLDGQYVPGQEDQDVKILCNSIKQSSAAQAMTMTMLVAHFTVGCRSGFMCMTFYRRDGHVIEVQTGSAVSRPEEACSTPHFQQHNIPFLTLVSKYNRILFLCPVDSSRVFLPRHVRPFLLAIRERCRCL
ncbi:hypothetical protein E2986_14168 [Frieseomelitta varia]|uniref:Uncharacterized protein n=1 Tax=Frieseomelitta varia TaxID=561572 RepID=A0A833SP85_9HYME|nr:hypothetical protein E2986_14168 [Frieseomelitta varia]